MPGTLPSQSCRDPSRTFIPPQQRQPATLPGTWELASTLAGSASEGSVKHGAMEASGELLCDLERTQGPGHRVCRLEFSDLSVAQLQLSFPQTNKSNSA